MEIKIKLPDTMSAIRYWWNNPKGFWKYSIRIYGEEDFAIEFRRRLRAEEALSREAEKHQETRDKLITARKELSQLKRGEKSLGR